MTSSSGDLAQTLSAVMRGLDPRIHDEELQSQPYEGFDAGRVLMDCRVKPGNDKKRVSCARRYLREQALGQMQ
jgi:hypothetical protein